MGNLAEELLDFTPQCHHLRWLTDHLDGWQFGEQGLIEVLCDVLQLTEGLVIEFGAGDGVTLPLTIDRLCKADPERCILVEIDEERRKSLRKTYPNAWIAANQKWEPETWAMPAAIVVIDIDGSDSVVMRQMFQAGVRPTVLVVEHMDRHFPIATSGPALIPQWMLGMKLQSGHAIQDTAETLHAIAAQNGYERIGFNRCNSFFVVKERYTDLFR